MWAKKEEPPIVPPSGPIGTTLEGDCGNTVCDDGETHDTCYIDCTNPFGMFNAVKYDFDTDEWINSYAKELGIENARVNVWRVFVEPQDGVFNFYESDKLIYSLTDLNINVIVTLKGATPWANEIL